MTEHNENGSERRRAERIRINSAVEFVVDADVLNARSVDISETGLRFDSPTPIAVHLRMVIDGTESEREARLVWARRADSGDMSYGLEFIESDGPVASSTF